MAKRGKKGRSRSKSSPRTLTVRQYERLLDELHELLEAGQRRAEAAVGKQLVLTYHAVGRRLQAQKLTGNAGYGTATLQRLADDLDVKARTLQWAMALAQAYPDGPPTSGLRWSHYRELLRLRDTEQRGWYEQRAAELGWSAPKLIEAIREQQYRNVANDEAAVRRRPRPPQLRRPGGSPFVYKALIERVVDGDTLLADVDLGFHIRKQQRLRLAGIDTPKQTTAAGKRAQLFVQDELARVEFVMVITRKTDRYGRYLAHVFYAAGETDRDRIVSQGCYLNQALVDAGHAEPY